MIEKYVNKVTIANSFEILDELPDNCVQAIITDPEYDLGSKEKAWLHRQFIRICSGVIIVFMPPENQWILPADQYLFWVKPTSTKNTSKNYSRFVEMIFVYGRNGWYTGRHWSQYTNVFFDLVDDASLHPHRKPPSLIERLILNHVTWGNVILDPFAGSCVVGEVAHKFGIDSIMIEKDKKYANMLDF